MFTRSLKNIFNPMRYTGNMYIYAHIYYTGYILVKKDKLQHWNNN